jgi:hypothetical protein
MRFFSNKIYVNGAAKNFNDIVNDVAGGMNKQASAAAEPSIQKEAKKGEKPAFLKGKGDPSKGKKSEKSEKPAKGGLTPAQKKLPIGLQKAIAAKKSSVNGEDVKIASIAANGKDSVEIEFVSSEAKYAEIEITDDGQVKSAGKGGMMVSEPIVPKGKSMGYEGMGYEGMGDEGMTDEGTTDEGMGSEGMGDEGCESCGTTMASSSDFVKIANLTDKQKSAFRSYWQNVWPKEFIDAVLDKDQ